MNNRFGICLQQYIPVRADNSEASEMVTQILFGNLFSVIRMDKSNKFVYVQVEDDGYTGWVDLKTIHFIKESEYRRIKSLPLFFVNKRFYNVIDKNEDAIWLSYGSSLRIESGGIIYGTNSIFTSEAESENPGKIIQNAAECWINTSYIWGGKTTFGADCSGMVQNIFRHAGKHIPRDSGQQALVGKNINLVTEAKPGDLAFFDNDEGEIVHVGIVLSEKRILHASGKVRVDPFDQHGIYSMENSAYTHKLRLIRNILD